MARLSAQPLKCSTSPTKKSACAETQKGTWYLPPKAAAK
eukprot:CAMPEP_0117536988 /NCGR_PEP_ID=MMETSP0784-20121206/41733_1 /TAXON_ID=39447 /ORGANISM="" /LENGTH=38 /DNA_ID= /DNA_START= /DNA_END= /DNA_ORIENTATION=